MSKKHTSHDLIAMLLAVATAGSNMEPTPGKGTKGPHGGMDALGALGMSNASRWGCAILLASYQDDPLARKEALARCVRFVWLTWLTTADERHTVTVAQARSLANMALNHHCNPERARRTPARSMARQVGVSYESWVKKYRTHYHRLKAELAYEEDQAARQLMKRMGGKS